MNELAYRFAADCVLIVHVLFVAFVVVGLLLILAGGWLRWRWVRHPWMRLAHLLAIGIVVLQSWAGMICPLTTWEMALRERAGGATYSGGFIAHWMEKLLYYDAPARVFTAAYTVFALLVVASWLLVRPRPFHDKSRVP